MTTDTALLEVLLNTDYDDIPMGTRHRVLGEALLYLEVAMTTNSLLGIEGVRAVPNMRWWCHDWGGNINAYLSGLWYMTTAQEVVKYIPVTTDNILMYLEEVAIQDNADVLADLPKDTIPPHDWDGVVIPSEYVRDRLHSIMGLLPIMRDSYRHATDRWGVELPIEVPDSDED
jgi:hypothetical protein